MEAVDVALLLDELRDLGADHFGVEAKRAKGGPPSRLWETISAFANARGGVLLLGVEESANFRVVGVDDPAGMEHYLAGVCADSMDPPVRAVIRTARLQGKAVVIAEIPALARLRRPCHYKGEGPYGGSYIRMSDGDRRLTDYEVGLLLADRGQPREDERPIAGASVADLDPELLLQYLARLRRDKPRLFGLGDDQSVLRLTRVLVPDETTGAPVPSVAGLLAMGTYPQAFLPQVNLTFVNYPTSERGEPGPGGERFLDNVSIDGPVTVMTDDAMARLRQRMARRSVISGVARRDFYEYPEEAVREALVNALAHRDLSAGALGTQVQVELFPDRLEVRNPGGLHGPVGIDDLTTAATSSARNATLYKILENVPLPGGAGVVCENRGSGIRAMVAALRKAGMSQPLFADNIATFEVVFPNVTLLDDETVAWLAGLGQGGLSDGQILALARMRRGEVLKNSTYRDGTGVDSRIATVELRDLVTRGLATVDGLRGGATYESTSRPSPGPGRLPPLSTSGERRAGRVERVPRTAVDVYEALSTGPLSRAELQERLGLPAHAVSYRLRLLRDAGLVEIFEGTARAPNAQWHRSPVTD